MDQDAKNWINSQEIYLHELKLELDELEVEVEGFIKAQRIKNRLILVKRDRIQDGILRLEEYKRSFS